MNSHGGQHQITYKTTFTEQLLANVLGDKIIQQPTVIIKRNHDPQLGDSNGIDRQAKNVSPMFWRRPGPRFVNGVKNVKDCT